MKFRFWRSFFVDLQSRFRFALLGLCESFVMNSFHDFELGR